MAEGGTHLARALSDGEDRIVSADGPLARLQLRCGGDVPGVIAIPALLETVRKSRRYGLTLSRSIRAQTGQEAITAWVDVTPRDDGELGCDIVLRHYQSSQLPPEDAEAMQHRRTGIDQQLAELTARLDSGQRLLSVEADAPDLQAQAEAMRQGLGQAWTDFVEVEGNSHHQPLHWRLLDGAGVSVAGSERPWRAGLIPLGRPGEEPTGFELAFTSEQPPPQPELPQTGHANSTPGMVGRDIAPVLRQPISRIIANAETIRTRLAGPLADEYSDYASDIAAAGQHLLALLDDLSDLEVVEAEDFSTAPDRIDLADVARRAAGILGVRARERGIVLDPPRTDESLPAVAEFRRVLQILLNLIGNAVRYSPANSQVWIRLEERDGKACVVVADQGQGMSDEEQARIFEKFERLGRSGDGGSGLGLYISRRLARAMGGELSVESAPGQGARFTLELPGEA